MDRKIQKLCLKDFAIDPSKLKLRASLVDLSVGGSKRPQKKYVPNVNAARKADRSQNFVNQVEKPISKPKIVEKKLNEKVPVFTEGYFGGPGPSSTSHIEKRERAKKSEKYSEELTVPIYRGIEEIDEEHEQAVLDSLLGKGRSSPTELEENVPFKPVYWSKPWNFDDDKVNLEKKIKTEEELNPEEEINPKKKISRSEKELSHMLESYDSNPKMSLWGFPSPFPFQMDAGSSKPTEPVNLSLADLPPGQFGKLLIRKSGKVEAVIGNITYQLGPLSCDEYQTLVSINVDAKKGEAKVLGNVDEGFMLFPKLENFLRKKNER